MRVKNLQRKEEILRAAFCLLLENGYEHASMDKISKRLGYSKATIYNYFHSKQALFFAAMISFCETETNIMLTMLNTLKCNDEDNFWQQLEQISIYYLRFMLRTEIVKLTRLLTFEGERFGLNQQLYLREAKSLWGPLTDIIAHHMENGFLRKHDATIAVIQYKGLLECNLLNKRIGGIITTTTEEQICHDVKCAIETFRLAYSQ